MTIVELREKLYRAEEEMGPLFERVSREIFLHPEEGDREFYSSRYLTEQMEKLGFTVTMPYCGISTAFRCEFGDEDGPTVAFLAEYDALPGYANSPNGDGYAHACGHNWIAASTFAAAAALAGIKEHFQGKIVYLGTPAEETMGRKIDLIEAGAFDDIDAVFQMHLGRETYLETAALAMTDFYFTFTGRAAHAAANPESGINALDAVNLTFAGINCLRQHVTGDVRLHGYIIEGGTACNIVPDHCKMQLMVRAANKDYLEEVVERALNCARGAAMMTGTRLEIKRAQNTYYDLKLYPELIERMREHLMEQGINDLRRKSVYGAGSTDIGNVSYACPTAYIELGTGAVSPCDCHDAGYLDVVDSDYAHRLLHQGAKAMAATALDVLTDEQLRKALSAR